MRRFTRGLDPWIGAAILFPIAAAVAVAFGAWWAPFPLGLVFGVLQCRARIAIPVGAVTGLVGWSIPLALLATRHGIGPAASALSAILGFGHQGAYAVALTLLVGLLLGLTGGWLGSVAWTSINRLGRKRPAKPLGTSPFPVKSPARPGDGAPRSRETVPPSPRKG